MKNKTITREEFLNYRNGNIFGITAKKQRKKTLGKKKKKKLKQKKLEFE